MSGPIALALAALALFVALISFVAQREMQHNLLQIRSTLNMVDAPSPVDIGSIRDQRPARYGLPPALDSTPHALLLVLSTKCVTCHSIASNLRDVVPPLVWILIEDGDEFPSPFMQRHNLSGDRVLLDTNQTVADGMGIDLTPIGIRIHGGRIADGVVLTSVRQLWDLLPETTPLAN